MQWIINEKWEVIAIANSCLNMVDWYEVFEVEDAEIKIWYIRNKDWTFEKWENLIKQEEVEKFKAVCKRIIELEQKELVKWYLTSELENTKNSLNSTKEETVIDEKQEAIIELNNRYEELIKKYWEDIKNELF